MPGSPRLRLAACAALAGMALITGPATAAPACPNAGWTIVEPKASPATRPVKAGPRTIFARRSQITATADLTEIKLAGDAYDTLVQMRFTPEAAKRLHDATTNRDGLHIAFVVDDRAISAVTWTGPYGMDAESGAQISLGKAVPEVRAIVASLQGCVRPAAR
jgi:preprotein translocase subunit SecD